MRDFSLQGICLSMVPGLTEEDLAVRGRRLGRRGRSEGGAHFTCNIQEYNI